MYIDIYGWQDRKVSNAKYDDSGFYVYYYLGKNVRRKNITKECRAYFKERGSRFTRGIKEQLLATVPDTLCIWADLVPVYGQYYPGNIKCYRIITRIDEEDLIEKWLSKVIL